MTRGGDETTEPEDEVSDLVDQSELIGDDRTEFDRWDETDSDDCYHKYADRKVTYLKKWDDFSVKTTAETLSVCRKCGFVPEKRRY